MIPFSANISMLFGELPLEERFGAAAKAGFDAVEIQFPYVLRAEDCDRYARDAGLPILMINTPPSADGLNGRAAQSAERFLPDLDRASDYVEATGARLLHVMTGPGRLRDAAQLASLAENLERACERLSGLDAVVVIEPLNPFDFPGYALADFNVAAGLIDRSAWPNLRLLFDAYHFERIEGDAPAGLRRHGARIAHVQLASAADRGEPDDEAPDLTRLMRGLRDMGYQGAVGAEYRPRAGTSAGLGWLETARRACS